LPAAQLEFIDPTLDDCYHLAIAYELRRFALSSYLVWFAAFIPLHNLYSGIHRALLGFVDDCKQGTCHWIQRNESSREPLLLCFQEVKNDGIVGFWAVVTREIAGI
jgi:hypothetical protein